MEQLSMPITFAVVLVMRWRVVSRSSAEPMALLMARRAESSAVFRFRNSWVASAIGICRHHTAVSLFEGIDNLRAHGEVLAPEEPLVDLQRIEGGFPRFVNLKWPVVRILGHGHIYEFDNLPMLIDERHSQRDEGVLHPESP